MNQWGGNEPVGGGNEPVGGGNEPVGGVDLGGRRKPFLGLSVQFALLYKSPLLELILSGS